MWTRFSALSRRLGALLLALCAGLPFAACDDSGGQPPVTAARPAASAAVAAAPAAPDAAALRDGAGEAGGAGAPAGREEAPAGKEPCPDPAETEAEAMRAAARETGAASDAAPDPRPEADGAGADGPEPERAAAGVLPETPDAGSGEVIAVYPLAVPGEEAPEAEREAAWARVDYVNRVHEALADSECGRRPLRILQAVQNYREYFVAERIPGSPPDKGCAAKLVPGTELFGDEAGELAALLGRVDERRTAMQRDYVALQKYVADESIMDDGARGEKLCASMEEAYMAFDDARERVFGLIEGPAEEAQITLLRAHPLREQVRASLRLFADIRRASDFIAPGEPDPLALAPFIEALDRDATVAERLPFPTPGEVEMRYRHFLKEVRGLQAILERGSLESFYPPVRAALSSAFRRCRKTYALFQDALEGEGTSE